MDGLGTFKKFCTSLPEGRAPVAALAPVPALAPVLPALAARRACFGARACFRRRSSDDWPQESKDDLRAATRH